MRTLFLFALTIYFLFHKSAFAIASTAESAAPSKVELSFPKIFDTASAVGPWTLQEWDLNQLFIHELTRQFTNTQNRLSQYMVSSMRPGAMQALTNYLQTRNARVDRGAVLVDFASDLDKIIEGKRIYTDERFSQISLEADTRELLKRGDKERRDSRLNRLLLEDAYPRLFPKSERLFMDVRSACVAHVNFRNQTVQFYDETGQKTALIDLAEENSKITRSLPVPKYVMSKNFPSLNGITYYHFTPVSFLAVTEGNTYEIVLKTGELKILDKKPDNRR